MRFQCLQHPDYVKYHKYHMEEEGYMSSEWKYGTDDTGDWYAEID